VIENDAVVVDDLPFVTELDRFPSRPFAIGCEADLPVPSMPPSGPPLQVADRYAGGSRAGDDDRHGEAA
jgi:hypothetical protein